MHHKRLILSVIITFFFLFLIKDVFILNKPIKLVFYADGSQETEFKIYYTTNKTEQYSENLFVQKTVNLNKTRRVAVTIPARKIYGLRIDFPQSLSAITISNMTLRGRKTYNLSQHFSSLTYNDINKHQIQDGKLFLDFERLPDAFIAFDNRMKVKASNKIDIHLFIIAITLSFLFFYKLVNYLAKFKIIENNSRIDIVFICSFFILLFIPMSKINYAEISEQENRTLQKYIPLFHNGILNSQFGTNFEKWYNDRFRGRSLLIDFYNKIFCFVNNKMENEKAFKGKDNWLFYKPENGIKNFQNAILFSDTELKNIAKFLNDFQNWCAQNHKKFYFVIAPDKNKIYGEYFYDIAKIRPDTESKTRQLLAYLEKNSDVTTIYPYAILHENKDKGLLYWKNNTHWNELGAYYGYWDIIQHIRNDFPQIPEANIIGFTQEKHLKGDLTKMFSPSQQYEEHTLYKKPIIESNEKCMANDSGKDISCKNDTGRLNLVMFRDSFTTSMIPYLAQSFKNARFLWHYKLSKQDLDIMKYADVIILEIVERGTYIMSQIKFPEN